MESLIAGNTGVIVTGIFAILVTIFYRYVSWKQNYWARLGLNGPKPKFLVGNLERFRGSLSEIEIGWAKKFGHVYGYYLGMVPMLTISDPELVKRVMVRDFHQFVNRQIVNVYHEIMTENLFLLEGERWKRIRSIVTPTFTSGKLRGMHQLMNRAVDKLAVYFDQLIEEDEISPITTKKVIAGFTIDVIATTTFATETNTNGNRTEKSPFIEHGLKIFDVNPLKGVAILALPKWVNISILGIEYLPPKKPAEFFMNLTKTITRQRKSAPTSAKKRIDLVQLLLDASLDENELKNTNWNKLAVEIGDQEPEKEETTKSSQNGSSNVSRLTENEVVAQCIVFFLAGFETTATTISNILFELAKNPEVQQRLNDELCLVLGDPASSSNLDRNSEEYYDKVVNRIPYLEAVIKETLRKYPPVVRLNRRLGSDRYQLTDKLEIKKDQNIEIAVYSIHYNPEFYPEPQKFNPDRFMPENQHLLIPYTWIPFGTGPRNCVGMRFALQEIKLMLAHIIPRYRFATTVNTPDQLKFKNGAVLLLSYPFELSISKRQK